LGILTITDGVYIIDWLHLSLYILHLTLYILHLTFVSRALTLVSRGLTLFDYNNRIIYNNYYNKIPSESFIISQP
jgi:hypothetical protein